MCKRIPFLEQYYVGSIKPSVGSLSQVHYRDLAIKKTLLAIQVTVCFNKALYSLCTKCSPRQIPPDKTAPFGTSCNTTKAHITWRIPVSVSVLSDSLETFVQT